MPASAHSEYSSDRYWTDQLSVLNRLYRAAVAQIRLAESSKADPVGDADPAAVLRAERLILEIIAGLNPSLGEIPQQVHRLCHFCLRCLEDGSRERLRAAADVLTTLAEAFSEIAGEVHRLESAGELPDCQVRQSVIDQMV